jgi:hypothetical protein
MSSALRRNHPRHTGRTLMRRATLLSAVLLALALAACGGGGHRSTTKSQTTTPSTTSTSQTPATGASSVTSGPVRGTLSAQNHAPKVGKSWRYSVTLTDAAGHPVSGTVDIEFVFGEQVVGRDTPPTHPVRNGHWTDTLKFPTDAVGEPLTFQAVVHTGVGSITLDWPITVQR